MTESISDGGERDKASEDGNSKVSDAPIDQRNPSTPTSESASESASVPAISAPTVEDGEAQKNLDDGISPLEWKNRGNVYFGKEDWEQASHAYRSGLAALRERPPSTAAATSADDTVDPVEVALRSNMAFVLLKLQQYDQAEEECNQLLKIDPANVKGTILSIERNFSLRMMLWHVPFRLFLSFLNFLSPLDQKLSIDGRVHVRASTFHSTTIIRPITLWIPLVMSTATNILKRKIAWHSCRRLLLTLSRLSIISRKN